MPRFLLLPIALLFPVLLSLLISAASAPLVRDLAQESGAHVATVLNGKTSLPFPPPGSALALKQSVAFWSVRALFVATPMAAIFLLGGGAASTAHRINLLTALAAGFCLGALVGGFLWMSWPQVFLWLAIGNAVALGLSFLRPPVLRRRP